MTPKSEEQHDEQRQSMLVDSKVKSVIDFDDILPHVGEFGTYQRLLFVAMIPFALFFACVYFVQIFITVTPQQHWCRVPELGNLTVEQRRNLSIPYDDVLGYSRCRMYVANWSQVLESGGDPDPHWQTASCSHGWEFNHSDIPYKTITTELEWVCERDSYPALAQSFFFCGSIVGGILFGWIADRFGRLPALVGSNLVGCAGGLATMYSTSLWDFSFYRFLVGMAYDNCFIMIYILALEFVGARYRTWVANMSIALFFGLGCIMLPWLALWVADWRRLLLVTSAPMLIALLLPWLVPESPRWLITQGRVDEAIVILKKLEKVNKKKIPEDLLNDFVISSRLIKKSTASVLELFKSRPLCKMMIYLIIVYMACALVFDGLVRLSDTLGLDFFITFTLTSATEIPSVTLLAFILDKFGRRWLACGPMVISGIFCLVAVFVPNGVPTVTLAILARFAINMSYNAAIQWSAELLPTSARASGSSLVHICGYIATMLSPFVVYTEKLLPSLPILVLSLTALAGGIISLLIPETKDRDMPQTFDEGERRMLEHRTFRKTKDIEMKDWKEITEAKQRKPLNENLS